MANGDHPSAKLFLGALTVLCLGAIGIQFIRPELKNPPVTADLSAPPAVKQIIQTSCYNCHSNETKLSWFDLPAPAYWLVASDVRKGRSRLNFSEIGKLAAGQQAAALFESVSQIELGAMPLPAYQRLHPESVITPEKLAVLKNYLASLELKQPATAAEAASADAQYDDWIAHPGTQQVTPAPNGIAFPSDYRNWHAISSTDRLDNRTMRVILGNDTAIKAIAENHINPWPDGATFAKVAWYQQPDNAGLVRTGAFFQVEFMIRDRTKYARTLGWGFARWRGAGLKPYGRDAGFAEECVGCHKPMRKADYVFTAPIGGQP